MIAIEIDPVKIKCARNNAAIYGVEDKIEFIEGDFFTVCKGVQADAVFLSPPWGGPDYLHEDTYDLNHMPLGPASSLLAEARKISNEVALYLPRNIDLDQVAVLAGEGQGGAVEVEKDFLNDRCKAFVAYFAGLARPR